MDNELDDGEKKLIKKYWQEWNESLKDDEYKKIFDYITSEFNKNSSIEKLHQCIHDIKTHFINLYKKDETLTNEEFTKKVNKQLSLILRDLMWLSYADGFCDDKEFKFIEAPAVSYPVSASTFVSSEFNTYSVCIKFPSILEEPLTLKRLVELISPVDGFPVLSV